LRLVEAAIFSIYSKTDNPSLGCSFENIGPIFVVVAVETIYLGSVVVRQSDSTKRFDKAAGVITSLSGTFLILSLWESRRLSGGEGVDNKSIENRCLGMDPPRA
jgi:hypothetical protein